MESWHSELLNHHLYQFSYRHEIQNVAYEADDQQDELHRPHEYIGELGIDRDAVDEGNGEETDRYWPREEAHQIRRYDGIEELAAERAQPAIQTIA